MAPPARQRVESGRARLGSLLTLLDVLERASESGRARLGRPDGETISSLTELADEHGIRSPAELIQQPASPVSARAPETGAARLADAFRRAQ